MHDHDNVEESLILPSSLTDLAKDAAYLEGLTRLNCITTVGSFSHRTNVLRVFTVTSGNAR